MPRRAFNCRAASAFTLIELLVVIAVVAVLAGLLFSVLGSVQKSGKAAQCVSNMRQVYGALNLYAQDHANTMPQRHYPTTYDASGTTYGYTELLLGYVDPGHKPQNSAVARKLYTCPSQLETDYPAQPGYGMNWFYDNARLSSISQPTKTIALAETLGNSGTGSRRADRNYDTDETGRLDEKRHQGKANYVFFDGHMASLTYAETRRIVTPSDEDPPTDLWGKDYERHDEPAPPPPYDS